MNIIDAWKVAKVGQRIKRENCERQIVYIKQCESITDFLRCGLSEASAYANDWMVLKDTRIHVFNNVKICCTKTLFCDRYYPRFDNLNDLATYMQLLGKTFKMTLEWEE